MVFPFVVVRGLTGLSVIIKETHIHFPLYVNRAEMVFLVLRQDVYVIDFASKGILW